MTAPLNLPTECPMCGRPVEFILEGVSNGLDPEWLGGYVMEEPCPCGFDMEWKPPGQSLLWPRSLPPMPDLFLGAIRDSRT